MSTSEASLATEPVPKEINNCDDLHATRNSKAKALPSSEDPKSPEPFATQGDLVRRISTNSNRSTSGATTLNQTRPHAPIGTRSKEVGPGEIVGRFVGGVLRSPLDLTLTLARGFNNAPKLYGDTTVRKPDKIDNLQSGLKMAGKVC